MDAHDLAEQHLWVNGELWVEGVRGRKKERLPGVCRSAEPAERSLAGGVTVRVFALRLVDPCTRSSAVWVDKTVVLDVLRSFATDLML